MNAETKINLLNKFERLNTLTLKYQEILDGIIVTLELDAQQRAKRGEGPGHPTDDDLKDLKRDALDAGFTGAAEAIDTVLERMDVETALGLGNPTFSTEFPRRRFCAAQWRGAARTWMKN